MKWLTRLTVLDKEYDGFFMKTAYRHPGRPVRPGAAVIRRYAAGHEPAREVRDQHAGGRHGRATRKAACDHGRGLSGDAGPVSAVDVSIDGGRTWTAAKLGVDRSQFGWRLFSHSFTPSKAQFYTLMARAGRRRVTSSQWLRSGTRQATSGERCAGGRRKRDGQAGAADDGRRLHGKARGRPARSGYRQACLTCHGEDVIQQQKLTKAQWQREVDKMVRWGAQIKDGDREGILQYLATHF